MTETWAMLARLGRALGARASSPPAESLVVRIPEQIRSRLMSDNDEEPLFPKLVRYGRGKPGVTAESDGWWVIRDARGRVVGGAMVASIGADHPVAIDVAVDPKRQQQGLGTALYKALAAAGVDVEAGSRASLAHRTMTPLGYLFMRSRRRRTDPYAESTIIASANVCPGCGPLP